MSLQLSQKQADPSLQAVSKSPSNPNKGQTFPEKVWGMLACFRSVHLAIVLLSLLAVATLTGVLMPQEGVVELSEIKRTFGPNFRMLKAMGFFSVYSSYWFIALEVLFFFNLLFGSFQWLKPAFLAATRKVFCGPEHIQASPHRLEFESGKPLGIVTNEVISTLKKARYQVHTAKGQQDGSVRVYASKGNFSRLGPVMAHTGILLLLVSSVYGVFFGFKAQQLAVPGQTFEIANAGMFRPNIDQSLWQGSIPDWKVKVNDFTIEYYSEGEAPGPMATVKQYYADLSVISPKGEVMKRETISVNHPLSVDNTTIYQASFNPTGKLFVEVNGKPMKLDANTQFMNRPVSMTPLGNGMTLMAFPFFVQQDPQVTRNYVVFFLRDKNGFVGAQPGKMPPNLRLLEGESGTLSGMTFTYVKPEIATGLQIKKGPEVPWMYLAYVIVIIGTIMCIFSQRRLWLAITDEDGKRQVRLLYKTNKARISFMKELKRLQATLNARLQTPANPVSNPLPEAAPEPVAAGR